MDDEPEVDKSRRAEGRLMAANTTNNNIGDLLPLPPKNDAKSLQFSGCKPRPAQLENEGKLSPRKLGYIESDKDWNLQYIASGSHTDSSIDLIAYTGNGAR